MLCFKSHNHHSNERSTGANNSGIMYHSVVLVYKSLLWIADLKQCMMVSYQILQEKKVRLWVYWWQYDIYNTPQNMEESQCQWVSFLDNICDNQRKCKEQHHHTVHEFDNHHRFQYSLIDQQCQCQRLRLNGSSDLFCLRLILSESESLPNVPQKVVFLWFNVSHSREPSLTDRLHNAV